MGRNDVLKYAAAVTISLIVAFYGCGNAGSSVPPFDQNRSFGFLVRQMEFGPRVPGADAHKNARDWLVAELKQLTSNVAVQKFEGNYAGYDPEMYNIVASFNPDKKRRILLCAHWDSRPFADRDPDPANHTAPVPGANDGASGVAVLLEIARIVAATPPSVGVDIALFDGEDGGSYGDNDSWLLGSRHFARVMPKTYKPEYAILLDMIGDSDLSLSRDVNSIAAAPLLWDRMTAAAGTIGIPFEPEDMSVVDDHIPLIDRGIPAIDLIDFNYTPWHTIGDTADKCSAESLGKIGTLVLTLIYGER